MTERKRRARLLDGDVKKLTRDHGELLRITERLAGHVARLEAFTRAHTRGQEGIDHG